MKLRIRWARPTGKHAWASLLLRIALIAVAAVVLIGFSVFGYFYVKYQHVVDERLKQPIFANTAKIFAAPREVRPGQKLNQSLIANELREAGYSADGASQVSPLGTYSESVQAITVRPGPQSYHAPDSALIRINAGVVESIADVMNSSRCSSPASERTPTAPSAASSATTRFRPIWSRPCSPSKTAASSSTAASTMGGSWRPSIAT
jgi:hypothetical protein